MFQFRRFPAYAYLIQRTLPDLIWRVSPFGNLRIVAYVQLPEAYRSLSRPSSAPDAKAFPLRSFLLDLTIESWSIAVLRIMQAREFLLAIVVYPNFLVPH